MSAYVERTPLLYLLGAARERYVAGETWYGFTRCYPLILKGRTASETVEKIMAEVVQVAGILVGD